MDSGDSGVDAGPAVATVIVAPAPTEPPAAPARPIPWPAAIACAGLSGVALLYAFPPYDAWWLAPVAVAVLALAAHRRRPAAAAGLGATTGLAFFAPLLTWTNIEVGYLPWLLLAGCQAAYVAGMAAAAGYLSPVVDRWRWSWPLLTAALWVAQEALRSRTPFGGFPWGRLAFSQGDSPLLRLAALGGAPLVTFAVALAGGLLAAAAWTVVDRRAALMSVRGAAWARPAALVAAATAVVASGLAVPVTDPARDAAGARVIVAVVQGNVPRLGLDFNAQRRAVLDKHVTATVRLAQDVAAGRRPQPDLVVWPENSSDIDPLRNASAADGIGRAAAAIGVPILVGAVLRDPEEAGPHNAGIVWRPGTGPDQIYVKRHPVPFAEYIPLRSLARLVYPDVDRRVRSDFLPGDRPGVLTVGPAVVGDVICFEVAYDGVVRDTVTGGGQLLAVQTNNATFNEAEALQQLAMVRLRAVEHGREALMASTVGVSAFVGTDGRVHDATGFFTPEVIVRELTLTDDRTPATTVGAAPELALFAVAAAALGVAAALRRRRAVPGRG